MSFEKFMLKLSKNLPKLFSIFSSIKLFFNNSSNSSIFLQDNNFEFSKFVIFKKKVNKILTTCGFNKKIISFILLLIVIFISSKINDILTSKKTSSSKIKIGKIFFSSKSLEISLLLSIIKKSPI